MAKPNGSLHVAVKLVMPISLTYVPGVTVAVCGVFTTLLSEQALEIDTFTSSITGSADSAFAVLTTNDPPPRRG